MKRKLFSSFLIVALLHYFQGCIIYKDTKNADTEGLQNSGTKVVSAVLFSGEVIKFDNNGGEVVARKAGTGGKSDTLTGCFVEGITDGKSFVQIPVDKVLYVVNKKVDGVMTFIATVGVLAGAALVVVLIALATKKSCPFIYSFDGTDYIFDAEPLGGAIAKAFERTDFSKLTHLKETDGVYRLRITNEVHETEYIDEMSLFVVDHPKGSTVTMNNDGKIYALKNMEAPVYTADENGEDITPFVREKDEVIWMSRMPVTDSNKLRHKISLGFNKPRGAKKAWLVYNTGTTHWGSVMISEMLELYGTGLQEHYAKLNEKGDYYNNTVNFLQKEELYEMKLLMKAGGQWENQGMLQGGGPFKTDERVMELDLTGVEGDMVELQMNPPVGFWTLGYFGITYDQPFPAKGRKVKVAKTLDNNGNNINDLISLSDEKYHLMPETGDWFSVEYRAPEKPDDLDRTVFMKTKGWYDIHMPELTKEPDLKTLFGLISKPGAVVKFSNERYIKWTERAAF